MQKINPLFSQLEGRILCFGIDCEEELRYIKENKKIEECFLLNSMDLMESEAGKKRSKIRKTSPKKLLKKFGKKGIDFLVIQEENFEKYEKKLLPLMIQLTKRKIYLYHVPNYQKIEKKYKRYHGVVHTKKEYMEVDLKNAKQNYFLNKLYYLGDSFLDFIDLISDILAS